MMTERNSCLFVSDNLDSIEAESVRSLRTNLLLRDFDGEIKVICFTSISPEEGKSTMAINLAYSYTQIEKKVLLIDCDLRIPSIHKKLGVRNQSGLVDVVSKFKTFDESVIHYKKGFDVLTAGTKIPFANDFLQSKSLQLFISECRTRYDYVFIDCPPLAYISDSLIISRYTDGMLFVLASGKNNKRNLLEVMKKIKSVKVNLLGVVMTKTELKHHNYDYSRYHSSAGSKKRRGRFDD